MKRVFLTGAAGFIGRTIAERLRRDGVEVTGVDRVADSVAGIVAGDIAEAGPWQEAAAGCDALIHTAALVGMPTDVSRFWAVNVLGTRRVLDAARAGGVRRVVHLSSIVTFGVDFPDGVDESYPVRPTGVAYTDTKIAAEQVVLMAHAAGEQEATIVRPGDVYGPRSRPWTILPIELLRKRMFMVPAYGRGIFSPVYVDDLADGIARAATAPAAAGRVITLSGGIGVETRDFFGRLAALVGRSVPAVPTGAMLALAVAADRASRLLGTPNELTPDGVRYLALRRGTYSISRARELLDWTPQTTLDEGMRRTGEWLRSEGLV